MLVKIPYNVPGSLRACLNIIQHQLHLSGEFGRGKSFNGQAFDKVYPLLSRNEDLLLALNISAFYELLDSIRPCRLSAYPAAFHLFFDLLVVDIPAGVFHRGYETSVGISFRRRSFSFGKLVFPCDLFALGKPREQRFLFGNGIDRHPSEGQHSFADSFEPKAVDSGNDCGLFDLSRRIG